MRIITLTSDMGTQDYYVAAVKAAILGLYPQAQIVDISHHLRPFDIAQAAFVIKNVYKSFPKGSIHILGINSEKTNPLMQPGAPLTRHVVVDYNGHYFIGADNGVFSLFLESAPTAVYEIDFGKEGEEHTFPVKTVFARAAAMIASGQNPDAFGHKINELNQRTIIAPTISSNLIIGTVIYIDSYGNAIFNITKTDFEKHTIGKDYKLVLRGGSHEIDSIRKTYNEVPEGEVVALFDSSGHLEIAINKGVEGNGGGAAGLLGLRLGDTVRVEF
ncbi:MAG TPA: SAM-dependent chlorinase/fluorinase [Flavobacteriales bacterium]|nr:SAM-dependent chlorinase/fluorinase [Flavobacteriales bacterium]